MNNFREIIDKFVNEDEIIRKISNFNEKNSKLIDFEIFSLINRIINHNQEDIILIMPAKKELAYTTSIISSIKFYLQEFESRLSNFSNWLTPGINVKLCASGNETGKIYKYLGTKDKNFILLGNLYDKSIKIEHKIETLLQLVPTNKKEIKKSEVGKNGFIPKPINPPIDEILGINSFNNPILLKNKIIVLTNFQNTYANFLKSENFLSEQYNLSELLSFSQIKDDGEIKDYEIEPSILYTKDLGAIYEYSGKTNNQKIIICDDVKKLQENYSIFRQIKENNKNFRFLIFAQENDYEYCKKLNDSEKINIWNLSKSEIKEIYNKIQKPLKDTFLNKAYYKSINNIKKKIVFLDIEETNFTQLNTKFKKILKISKLLDKNIEENIRDLTKDLFYKMYQLRDQIFGFTRDLKEETNQSINNFFLKLKTMESYLGNEFYDELIELGNLFKNILENEDNIFKKRLTELHENLKLREMDSKGDFAILTYGVEIKNYYKRNIKENWDLDVDVIYSTYSNKNYKNLIVPAELVQSKILTLLESDNFSNIYFIGGKSFKEEVNVVENKIHNRWLNMMIDNEKKCEITNINKDYSNAFFSAEQMRNSNITTNKEIDINLENFYEKDDFSKYIDKNNFEEKVSTIPAFLVVFNGDAYSFLTENYSTEIFNSVFDPSAYEKNPKIIKKDFRSIAYGDILLLRYSSDRTVLDRESIILLNNDSKKFNTLKYNTNKISLILKKFVGKPYRDRLKIFLKELNYQKGIVNVYSLAEPETGTICPENYSDLKKIFLACEKMSELFDNSQFKFDEKETLEIFKCAKIYKKIHISAGRSITQKLKNAVRKSKNLDFDGNPMRIDYSNGEIIFGSDEDGMPEGYIVQVKNFEEPRILNEHNSYSTNKLLFL